MDLKIYSQLNNKTMALSKEQILTLTCLKEVDVKGVGPQKIFAIGTAIDDRGLDINSYEDLAELMKSMKEAAIKKVTLSNLNDAYQIAQRIIEASNQANIGLVGYYDKEFPDVLRKTVNEDGKLDPPLLLWYRGDFSITEQPCFAVIGTREATPEGIAGGTYLSGEFAKRGFNIVSGLAVGCDTCGHKGALKVGGKTTAILANGLDHNSIYPPENQDLAEEIVENGGLLISEYRIGTPVNRYSLVARDRLQSGLSLATLVVQTGEHGGTMHAATSTLQAGKPLYTILFKDDATNQHEKCLGNALLVKQGAKYIKGNDNFDEISNSVKNWKPIKTDLFDV
jgi:DNA processing protein